MNQQTKNRYVAVTQQVDSMRKLYSQIGRPLPADIVIDLHRHLGKALALAEQTHESGRRENTHSRNHIM